MCFAQLRLRRYLRLLTLLQSRIGYNADYLAQELEVSRRTIYRDLRFLEESGVPVCYDPQKRGYTLERHFDISLSQLSDDEMTSLLMVTHIFSLTCIPKISTTLHQAIGKLLGQIPSQIRENIGDLLNSIRGNVSQSPWSEGSPSVVTEIMSAIRRKRPIRIEYIPPNDSSTPLHTKVTPDCLLASEGRWYLVGRSSWHRKVEHFDIGRIQKVKHLSDSCESSEQTYTETEHFGQPIMAERGPVVFASGPDAACLQPHRVCDVQRSAKS